MKPCVVCGRLAESTIQPDETIAEEAACPNCLFWALMFFLENTAVNSGGKSQSDIYSFLTNVVAIGNVYVPYHRTEGRS